jgi:4-amino-4-deoxychorismate lyase
VTARVLAVLGTGLVDPATPVLRADDLGVVRGDGVFETMLVRGGVPWLCEQHLARLVRSAARMDIDLPPVEEWRSLIADALTAWSPDEEGVLRLICTRGPEGGGAPTGLLYIGPVSPDTLRQRRDGVRVVTRTAGFSAASRTTAPWLLGGVKSTSYAVNMAVLRDAADAGADDVLLVSADGELLEGPTASVLWATGRTLHTISTDTGILGGTTVAHLLAEAPRHGFAACVTRARAEDLFAADGVWLVSAVRGVVPVLAVDGRQLPEPATTAELRRVLGW